MARNRAIKAANLKRMIDSDGLPAVQLHLMEALETKKIFPSDFSIQELAESLVVDHDGKPAGMEWVRMLGPQKSGGFSVQEATNAVDITAFSNITGQLAYSAIMEGYENPEFVASKLLSTRPTKLSGEKIPGITNITEAVEEVKPGMPYPQLGFGEDYRQTPATTKKGFIVAIEKETIFFDRTNLVLEKANSVGEIMGLNKEKEAWDLILGFVNNYNWKGTAYNTYQTAAPWINKISANPITDWTSIDAIEQLFANMLDPNTGEPINISASQLIYMPARRHLIRQITRAQQVETLTNTAATRTFSANTLDPYELIESKHAYRRLIANGISATNAKDYWLIGNFPKAFEWQENWPITVVQAPPNSEAEFRQDIVAQFKASQRGSAAVRDPRLSVLSING